MDRPAFDPRARYRFVFSFSHDDLQKGDDDDVNGITKLFHLELTEEQLSELRDEIDQGEDFLGTSEDLESDYGVHDFSTTGWEEVAGFSSYEVEPSKMDELMDKWRDWFTGRGITCGPIQTMSWDEYQETYRG